MSDSSSPEGGSRPDGSDSSSPEGGSRPDGSDSSSPEGGSRPDGSDLTAEGGHGAVPIKNIPVEPAPANVRHDWPLWEVFVRSKRGLNHVHVGSLHAADGDMAVHHARDVYTRRNEGVSIWVVRAAEIVASSPDEKDPFFAPSGDKVYRHPTFYEIPDDVPHM